MTEEIRLTQQIEQTFQRMGYYHIGGGIVGIGLMLWLMLQSTVDTFVVGMLTVAITLFAHSIYSGSLLVQQDEKGILHAQLNQVIQFLQVAMAGFSFSYCSGIGLLVGMDSRNSGLALDFHFSAFMVKLHSSPQIVQFQVNVVAIGVLILLHELKGKLRFRNKLLKEVNQ
jgi:hypothetical protein